MWGCLVAVLWAVMVAALLSSQEEWPAPLNLDTPELATWSQNGAEVLREAQLRKVGQGLLPLPEDLVAAPDGFLYVSCSDGWIKRIDPKSGSIKPWVHIPSGGHGRPLGLAIPPASSNGPVNVIVAHTYLGLLNVSENKVELLTEEAANLKFKLTDAAAVTSEGLIYFTDASYKYNMEQLQQDFFEARPHGRLLMYDPTTRSTTVLMDALYFANGVALSADERFLVVCESLLARCQRYWLKGPKSGSAEIFLHNLPANPDNIKNDGNGHFWIGLVSTRSLLLNELNKYPLLKGLSWRLTPSKIMDGYQSKAMVLCVREEDGHPLFLLSDPKGAAIRFVTSAVLVGEGDLYLGNLGEDFLGHVKLTDFDTSYFLQKNQTGLNPTDR